MSNLTAKTRKSLPKSKFGEPAERKYPVDTEARAGNAKARAAEEVHNGKLPKGAEKKIDEKADKVLSRGKKK